VTFEPDPITLPHATSTIFYAPNTSGVCVRVCVCVCAYALFECHVCIRVLVVSVFLSLIF